MQESEYIRASYSLLHHQLDTHKSAEMQQLLQMKNI
jgi:hypothetical protein